MKTVRTDIYQFQTQMSRRLAMWGTPMMLTGISIGAAMVIGRLGSRTRKGRQTMEDPRAEHPAMSTEPVMFTGGIASQCAGWGAIDLVIALLGLKAAKKHAADPAAHTPPQQIKARTNLSRILWINTGLDVGYVAGGAVLARTRDQQQPFWRGAGWGIVLQGGFLLIFDLIHALLLKH